MTVFARAKVVGHKIPVLTGHESPEIVSKFLGTDIWNNSQRFAGIRNPYDWTISLFHWRTGSTKSEGFESWLQDLGEERLFWELLSPIYFGKELAIDHVMPFEDMSNWLANPPMELKLPIELQLTAPAHRLSIGGREVGGEPRSAYFSSEGMARSMVLRVFEEVFELGNYPREIS